MMRGFRFFLEARGEGVGAVKIADLAGEPIGTSRVDMLDDRPVARIKKTVHAARSIHRPQWKRRLPSSLPSETDRNRQAYSQLVAFLLLFYPAR